MEFDSLEPLGIERLEWMLAKLIAVIWNSHVTKERNLKQPIDFMPDYGGERAEKETVMTGEEMLNLFRSKMTET